MNGAVFLRRLLEGFQAGRISRLNMTDWGPPDYLREELLWPNGSRRFKGGSKPLSDREGEGKTE